jgi:formate dehydrogenase subunit gamma
MTATPGSVGPTATEPRAAAPAPRFVPRFGATERTLHWVHALAFFVMLGTGLVLYLPALSNVFANRPLFKAIHLVTAVVWLAALALVAVLGNRRVLADDLGEIERFDADDVRWLRGEAARQGRFNAGQKAHAVVQAALAVLFTVSGVLLWLGERNTSFRLSGTIVLHDAAMYVAVALVLGHLFLSLVWPTTRPALRGIVRGSVDAAWAQAHHVKWRPAAGGAWTPPGAPAVGIAVVVAIAAGIGVALALSSSGI